MSYARSTSLEIHQCSLGEGAEITVFIKFNILLDDQSLKFSLIIIKFLFTINYILLETNHYLKFNFKIKCFNVCN